jgi:hypothetical protein
MLRSRKFSRRWSGVVCASGLFEVIIIIINTIIVARMILQYDESGRGEIKDGGSSFRCRF